MEALEFFASITNSLAWPAVIITVVLILKKPLGSFVDAIAKRVRWLKSIEGRGVSVNFEKEVEDTREKAEALERAVRSEPKLATEIRVGRAPQEGTRTAMARGVDDQDAYFQRLTAVAHVSPSAAIMEAFLHLEADVIETAADLGWSPSPNRPSDIMGAWRYLESHLPLDHSAKATFSQLRDLRNKSAHDIDLEVTYFDAMSYADATRSLMNLLSWLTAVEEEDDEEG